MQEGNKQILWGAIVGDVIGSTYEHSHSKNYNFELFRAGSRPTDDSVMTAAVADWHTNGGDLVAIMQQYGRRYPYAGYGGGFGRWLNAPTPKPYNSFGNGSAMRVSPVGWAFDTLQETLEVAEQTAAVTHNHPEGIKGAQAVAASIFLARTGHSKEEIKKYVQDKFSYDLERKYDDIKPVYSFDVTCQGSVPESIICFLESTDFEDAIRKAISMGGDADTMGAITGSIAEAYYGGVPDEIIEKVSSILPGELITSIHKFNWWFTEMGESSRHSLKFGVIDSYGNIVVKPYYSDMGAFYDGFCPVKIGQNWGVINNEFQMIISPQYPVMNCFEDGLAYVEKWGGEKGYIDIEGHFHPEDEVKESPNTKTFVNTTKLARKKINGKWGVIDNNSNFIIQPEWDEIHRGYDAKYDRIAVKRDGKWGFVNVQGELVIPPQFGDTRGFINGFAIVSTEAEPKNL